MNGEMNGEVVEKMDTSPQLSPHRKSFGDTKLVNPDINCGNSMDSESSLSQDDSNIATSVINENSNDSSQTNDRKLVQVAANHCTNSSNSLSNVSSHQRIDDEAKHTNHNSISKNTVHEIDSDQEDIKMDTNEDDSDEVDSEEDSSDEASGSEGSEARLQDAVSIKSESDTEGNHEKGISKHDRNMQNGGNSQSSEVHEIDSIDEEEEDCVVTNNTNNDSQSSDRSTKGSTDKSAGLENGEEESGLEERSDQDPLGLKSEKKKEVTNITGVISNITTNMETKELTPIVLDSNNIPRSKLTTKSSPTSQLSPSSAHNLYQSIAARGTTVTPVSVKGSPSIPPQPVNAATVLPILPSLTDDMFVVEAPSFIVPYVYEKPSLKPFREFVDILGRELEEQKLKEDEERLAKVKEEKAKKGENDVKLDSNDKSDSKVDDGNADIGKRDVEMKSPEKVEESEKKDGEESPKLRETRKGRKRRDEDDASWDGESSTESEEGLSDEDKTVIKEKGDDSMDGLKDPLTNEITDLKLVGVKTDSYFDNTLGKFFISIGINLVQEFVQNDLLKQQRRKLQKETRSGSGNTKATESAISQLMKNLQFSRETNAPYTFKQHKCEFCSFKTESSMVLSHHMETPHMKNNVYKCNFCPFEIRSPHDILFHMEAEHNVKGRLERAPAYHQCTNCPFEDNGKGKLARHMIPCAKKFKPEHNLAPPLEWEPPAKIPKISRARNNMVSTYQAAFNRSTVHQPMMNRPMLNPAAIAGGFRNRRMPVPPLRAGAIPGAPIIRGGLMVRHTVPSIPGTYPPQNAILKNAQSKMVHQPSISITPLPRAPQPAAASAAAKGSFVICEICDGYIKDLEQLRNHMQWIHKVKIHPKMIYNRPPLNCQKCQFRFFTDQGLERHLLGSHGLVTSSMQEAANKGKDAGRCPVCGRVYQWKLLNHVARDHNLTLKPAHLSYKCTVCTATFGMYKQFENHVYSAHSVVAKRVVDKGKPASATAPTVQAAQNKIPNENSAMKPLKINDEITIIPQVTKTSTVNVKTKKD